MIKYLNPAIGRAPDASTINSVNFDGNKTCEDFAFLTGAKVINEELGDDLDLIDIDCLGEAHTAM